MRTGRPRQRLFDEDAAVARYMLLKSSAKVAKEFGTGADLITRLLRKRGIEIGGAGPKPMQIPVSISEIQRRYSAGESCTGIAKTIGVQHHMVEKWLKQSGISFRKTKAQLDERFFEKIDTEEKAYWLGFLSADGNIGKDNAVRLELQEKDGLHVVKFANAISLKSQVYRRTDGRTEVGVQPKSILMVNDLLAQGLRAGDKSITLFPAHIPVDLECHYWRGMIDGDGCLSQNKGIPTISICGTKEVCVGFKEFLLRKGIQTDASVLQAGNIWNFSVSSKQTIDIAKLLYSGSNVYLERKIAIFEKWIGKYDEYSIVRIRSEVADDFLKVYHYLGGLRPGLVCYGLFIGGVLSGVACFGVPASQHTGASLVGKENSKRVWELARFALISDLEKNSASQFISKVLTVFQVDFPEIWFIVSYADSAQGHEGTIYVAAGAKLVGSGSKEIVIVTSGGSRLSGRSSAILAELEIQGVKLEDCSLALSEGKRKYVFVVGSGKQKAQRSGFLTTNMQPS